MPRHLMQGMVVRILALFFLSSLWLPLEALGATLRADDSLHITDSVQGNAYLAGAEVEISSALPADLLALGTVIRVLAQVTGDTLLAGGTVSIEAPIGGDARIVAGQINLTSSVAGEFAALARHIRMTGSAEEVRIAGGTIELLGGAEGPVSVYANKVILAGTFNDTVRIVAADTITVAEGTVIHGTLEYNAPQEASIPESATVDEDVIYVGSASFLPTPEEAQAFALAGFGLYIIVRIVAGMLLVGLLVGLFGALSRHVIHEATRVSLQRSIALFLLGFSCIVGTPFLILFLSVSVVGLGVAFLIGAVYLLALILSYAFGAALLGAVLTRVFFKRMEPSWPDAVFGVLALYVFGLIPGIGFLVSMVVISVAFGALLILSYRATRASSVDAHVYKKH